MKNCGKAAKIGLIRRLSNPRCEITIDSSNFIFVKEFEHIAKSLKTGCSIRIERPNGFIQENHVLKINVDYSEKDFSMTLSNRYRLDDPLSIFEDSYGNSTSSIASITTSNATILEKQQKQIDYLDVTRRQSLNLPQVSRTQLPEALIAREPVGGGAPSIILPSFQLIQTCSQTFLQCLWWGSRKICCSEQVSILRWLRLSAHSYPS